MTLEKLHKMTFEGAIEELQNDGYSITSYDILKEYAIEQLNNDNMFLALHILNALYDSVGESDYYSYDYSMGTLEAPTILEDIEDLEQFCD